jgi:metallo-beta-lactamase class B
MLANLVRAGFAILVAVNVCRAETTSGAPAKASPFSDRSYVTRLFNSWQAPVAPRHLLGNIYYVGAGGVSSYLITTPDGNILLDTGFEAMVPLILHSVEQLGFRLSDVKIILNSHAHLDHIGGHALMKRLTGAKVYLSAADARTAASGGADDFIPFPKDMILYAPVQADHIVNDGEQVTLGGTVLTAHLTPGHTRGATTWTMDATEAGRVYHVVFFSSTSLTAGTSLVQHPPYPELVQDYENTFAKLKTLPCDVFFAPHADQFGMTEKFAKLDRGDKPNPLIDPEGWRQLIATSEKIFRDQLAAEKAP